MSKRYRGIHDRFHYNPVPISSEDDRRFFGNIETYVEYDIGESIAETFMRQPPNEEVLKVQHMFPYVDDPSDDEAIAAYYFVTLMGADSKFIMTGRNTFIPVHLHTATRTVYSGGNPMLGFGGPDRLEQTRQFITAARNYVKQVQDFNRRNRAFDVKGKDLLRLYERILNLIIDRPHNLVATIIIDTATKAIERFAHYPNDYFRYDGVRVDEIIENGGIEDRVLRMLQKRIEEDKESSKSCDTRDTENTADMMHVHTVNASESEAIEKGRRIIEAVRRAGTAKPVKGRGEQAMQEASYVMWTYTLRGLESEIVSVPNSRRKDLLDLLIES